MNYKDLSYIDIIIKSVITFFALFIYTRILGKKQISQLTFFNYVAEISIGSIAANIVISDTVGFPKKLTVLTTWCLLTL